MSPGRARARARLAILSAIAAAALWLAFRHIDPHALRASLAGADLRWVAAALAGVAVATALAVTRWRLLFYPDPSRSWRHLTYALLVGQMANVVLPLRLGEIARVGVLSESERIPAARVLATIAVERLADVVMLGVGTALVFVTMTVPQGLEAPGRAVLVVALASFAASLALAWRPQALVRVTERLSGRAPVRLRAPLQRLVGDALAGLSALGSYRRAFVFWALSVACLVSAASVNYLLFRAFHFPLPASAALLLLVVLQIGNTAVSVPGNLGVFHYLTLLVLLSRGIDRNAALAFAFVLYAVTLGPKVLLGVVILAFGPSGFTFASVFRRKEALAE